MVSEYQADEKRRSSRRKAFIRASISHSDETELLGCVLCDISRDGALLEFRHTGNLPLSFWMRLEGEATLRFCTVAWRAKHHVGVEFSQQIVERRSAERRAIAAF